MICVEVLSNNVLTVKGNVSTNAVADSVKHETVKFFYPDNWKDYRKTAVFSAEGVEPVYVTLDRENMMCITEDECYIPFEVLRGDSFYLSVYGVNGDRLATATKVKIKVLESGYALGEEPMEPTPSEYAQIIAIMTKTQEIAQSVRDDADNGKFNGKPGPPGEGGSGTGGGLSSDLKSTLRTFFVNMQTLLTQIAYITENNLGNTVIQNAIDVVTALDNEPVIPDTPIVPDEPDIPDEPIDPESEVTQNGSVLTIVSGVTVTQNNSILSIA